jgi:hypothetical protein
MDSNSELASKWLGNGLGVGRPRVDARLKKLRQELRLIKRAITALSDLSQARSSRTRRGARV